MNLFLFILSDNGYKIQIAFLGWFKTNKCPVLVFYNFVFCVYRIHDRKLCVMGLLTLMALSPNRPIAVNEHATQIVPSMLMLFDGLNRAYSSKYKL